MKSDKSICEDEYTSLLTSISKLFSMFGIILEY